ncbi:MAG: hypothetical protein NC416_10695 [Eubacterium sp.]|nr:hypothetical protein [Eubacterium sp.]
MNVSGIGAIKGENMKINHIEKIYRYVIGSVSIAVLLLIAIYNAKMTSYLVKWEVTYYVKDSFFINMLSFGLLVLILMKFKQNKLYEILSNKFSEDRQFQKVKSVLLLIIFFEAAFWAVSTQFIPGVDEGEIQQFVFDFMKKDYYMFAPGGYMCRSADNRGLFLFECFISVVFGNKNYLVYELINSFAIAMIYKQFTEIMEEYKFNRIVQLSVIIIGVLFFPLIGYSIMVYGNLMGIALGVAAIKYELRFLGRYEWKNACKSAFFIIIAVLLKSNILIYLVAMTLFAILKLVVLQRKEILCFIILLILGYEMQSVIPTYILENITGYELDSPYSYWSFIAMGLQESELAPGWWNGYIHTNYWENDGDTQLQAIKAKESIKNSINQFTDDPQYAFCFFTKKIASTWANPTFQCFATVRNGSNIEVPHWVSAILSYPGQYIIVKYLNLMEFLILAGAITELLISWFESNYIDRLIFPMILVGGFFFHVFWEAKARYALMYFVVLIPYAVMGYTGLVAKLEEMYHRSINTMIKSVRTFTIRRLYFIVLNCILLSVYFYCYSDNNGGKILAENTEEYSIYLEEEGHRMLINKK